MPTHCPIRTGNRPFALARAVVVGSVVSALLPADAMGMVDVRRDPSGQVFATPRAQRGLPLPASAVRVPVQLRIRTGELAQKGDFDIGAIAQRGFAGARPAGGSRQVRPVRPNVTILSPTDLAAVPAGALRVRGTVNGHGDAVRVHVNGVRAVVRSGAFSATIRVTPHTLILSAVAATSGGLTDCHQIGLTVSETPETRPRLRPFLDHAVLALPQRFSLLPAAVLPSAQTDLDADGAGDIRAGGPSGLRFTVGGLVKGFSLPTVNATTDVNAAPPTSLVLAPARPDGRGPPTAPGPPEMDRRVDVESARRVLGTHLRPDDRVESITPADPGPSLRDLTGADSFSLRTRGEGDIEQNPRGMPVGAKYSFGLLIIFDANGFWQIRWY
jgi:hypothetical protein